MAAINIDLNTRINSVADIQSSAKNGGLIGTTISEKMFGVNFLSSFEFADNSVGGLNIDDILAAAGTVDRSVAVGESAGVTTPISNLRFPGGALTEEFFANTGTTLTLDTRVNFKSQKGISTREFIAQCADLKTDFSQVIPTWRYLDANGLTSQDRAEMGEFIRSLLTESLQKGVNVSAFEIGNEYWGQVTVDGVKNVRMTATQYGKIAADQAELIKQVIDEFESQFAGQIRASGNWTPPKVLIQLGCPSGDYSNEGYFKAQNDTRRILSEFETAAQKRAVDGFVMHRYESNIDVVGDPWVTAKPYHFAALADMLTGPDWKPVDQMELNVSEWNVWQSSTQTGLRAYSLVVAMMGEMASLGVDSAEFWSAGARSKFPMGRFDGGAYSPTATFLGLSFTGEAFRVMNESLQGKQSLALYQKSGGNLHGLDGNTFDMATGDNMRSYVEAFSDGKEVVIFVSNLSGAADTLNLDLSGMIGEKSSHAWGSLVTSSSANPLDNSAEPLIANMNLQLSGGVLSGFQLGAFQTLRITVTIGDYGGTILGYLANDRLDGSSFGDVIDGRAGNDSLNGLAGDDTIFGGAGNDSIFGGLGDDVIYGGAGNDSIGGSEGNDYFYGGDGSDWAMFHGNASISVDLRILGAQNTGYGSDVLDSMENVWTGNGSDTIRGNDLANSVKGGAGNDFIEGFGGNDRLEGNQGADTILAGNGHDTITGGPGNDVMSGAIGCDQFIFAKGSGLDVILDFSDGVDKIRFTTAHLTFDKLVIAEVSGGVSITHGVGDVIMLNSISLAQIGAEDFLFA